MKYWRSGFHNFDSGWLGITTRQTVNKLMYTRKSIILTFRYQITGSWQYLPEKTAGGRGMKTPYLVSREGDGEILPQRILRYLFLDEVSVPEKKTNVRRVRSWRSCCSVCSLPYTISMNIIPTSNSLLTVWFPTRSSFRLGLPTCLRFTLLQYKYEHRLYNQSTDTVFRWEHSLFTSSMTWHFVCAVHLIIGTKTNS